MLILARKSNERIMIGNDIEISIVEIRGDQVKLGIVAPPAVKVYRREVFDAIQAENEAAARAMPNDLSGLSGLFESRAATANHPADPADSSASDTQSPESEKRG